MKISYKKAIIKRWRIWKPNWKKNTNLNAKLSNSNARLTVKTKIYKRISFRLNNRINNWRWLNNKSSWIRISSRKNLVWKIKSSTNSIVIWSNSKIKIMVITIYFRFPAVKQNEKSRTRTSIAEIDRHGSTIYLNNR